MGAAGAAPLKTPTVRLLTAEALLEKSKTPFVKQALVNCDS
jgi:hypothetical protein